MIFPNDVKRARRLVVTRGAFVAACLVIACSAERRMSDATIDAMDADASGDVGGGRDGYPSPIEAGMTGPFPGVTARVAVSFNLDWKYLKGDASGAEAMSFADAPWTYVDLPHSTKFVTPEDPLAYLGVSWYRKHFTVAAAYEGSKVYLEIEAAMQAADVWINGVHKLQHQGGYTPFTVDLTGDVVYGGGDNVIAVKVNSNANAAWAPGWNGVDFQYHGGLYRNVSLHVMNGLHVSDAVYAGKPAGGGVFVTYPAVAIDAATVQVKTNVVNEFTVPRNAIVVTRLLDAMGQAVGTATAPAATIAPGADADFLQTIVVTKPRLWHPHAPNLYTVSVEVSDGTTVVDQVTTTAGIRRIEWSHAGGLSINGARFIALGVNMHQEMYGLGNAVPNQAITYDVKRIKDGGSDFIRGSHYPHAPAFYDACDALGVLVLDAQSGWQYFADTPAFTANTFQELRDLIRRDRNHPSVVAWEASLNESNFSDAWATTANGIVHEEYPGDQAFSAAWQWPHADIFIGASQHGVRSSADPRPIIVDEYGDWDYGGATSSTRQAREAGDRAMLTQANNLEDGLGKNMALPWLSAVGYWDWADYAGFSGTGMTRSGVVDMYRLPKIAYYFLQSQRDPAIVIPGVDSGPMVYIANQWTPTSPTTVRVYSNCDRVSLFLDDVLVATRAPDAGTKLLHPPFNFVVGAFTPGTLRADCLMGDMPTATFSRRTPGVASKLRLRSEAGGLSADASDARLVFIEVVDDVGTVVPGDNRQVMLAVRGPGALVGPATVTMKGGQLAAWVRSTRTAGMITVTASAEGLLAGSAELVSAAVDGLPPAPPDR